MMPLKNNIRAASCREPYGITRKYQGQRHFIFSAFFQLTVIIANAVLLPRKPRRLLVGKGIIAAFPHFQALP